MKKPHKLRIQQPKLESSEQGVTPLPTTDALRDNWQTFERETSLPTAQSYAVAKEQISSTGRLPPDAMHLHGQFAICSPAGAPFKGWYDMSWSDVLLPIEELVCFIERYDFPAWHLYENPKGEIVATATHLGVACDNYLPWVAHVRRDTLPQEGRRFTERFYVFIDACEETRQAGHTFFDSPLQDGLSRSLSVQAQNVLVDAIRTKMRMVTAFQLMKAHDL